MMRRRAAYFERRVRQQQAVRSLQKIHAPSSPDHPPLLLVAVHPMALAGLPFDRERLAHGCSRNTTEPANGAPPRVVKIF